ncbi:Serine/threonine-protein phosphatase 7 long form-like [Glycine soja]|uniref:Serine/threonine-protein phosphatase 7 long form-like n=1 Tax=Glycine soja TaxID=3848 RepID=A0A445H9L5_GLYSO|nr:Serine/threonine-protein phosphatase 7 long form-like [Glycine soja]
MSLILSEEKKYCSADSFDKSNELLNPAFGVLTPEFLNSLKTSGIPNHKLKIKVGIPIILLRNLDQADGLCNGTRLIVTRLGAHVVEAEIITNPNIGHRTYIPRVNMSSSDSPWPFKLIRRQFPFMVSFAMTINKSQGQPLAHVGLYLPNPVFSHGQLYVALSRVQSLKGLHIIIHDKEGTLKNTTINVVYKEVFANLQRRLVVGVLLSEACELSVNHELIEALSPLSELGESEKHLRTQRVISSLSKLKGVALRWKAKYLYWEILVKLDEDLEVAKFREQGLKFLPNIEFLFKGTIATGFAAYAPSEDSRQNERFNTRIEETNDNIDDNTDMEVNESEIDTTTQNTSSAKESGQRKRGMSSSLSSNDSSLSSNDSSSSDDDHIMKDKVLMFVVANVTNYFMNYVVKNSCRDSSMTGHCWDIIKPVDSSFRDTPDEILKDARYCPYFRDCIGAIDGTHIRVCVPSHLQGVYIGRKGYTTTNVMAVCDFCICFTFVWAGKYYLVDSSYPTFMGFLGPYKKTSSLSMIFLSPKAFSVARNNIEEGEIERRRSGKVVTVATNQFDWRVALEELFQGKVAGTRNRRRAGCSEGRTSRRKSQALVAIWLEEIPGFSGDLVEGNRRLQWRFGCLRVDGAPLIGPTNFEWADLCEELLGVRPQEGQLQGTVFMWEPYTTTVMSALPPICLVGSVAWCAVLPLICFHVVEWHQPDRVLRQFGMQQPIPECPSQLGVEMSQAKPSLTRLELGLS